MNATTLNELSAPCLLQSGTDQGRGNLLGIEPYMLPQDYASAESFFNKVDHYLRTAQQAGWLNARTVVVFPEYIGTWLVLAGEGLRTVQAATFESAQRSMVLRQPLRFLVQWLSAREKGRSESAFFRMKAAQMAEVYQTVFARLARQYAVTLVAGSIVLPPLQISSRGLTLSEGPLYNTSLVFRPDGSLHPHPVTKVYPTRQEMQFIAPTPAASLPVFDTPAGRLGVLICADSWYPQAYAPLKAQGVDLLAVPSFGAFSTHSWEHPWPGYNGWPLPSDVEPGDIKSLTEGQAWKKYSLAGRLQASGATHGLNVFLRGRLWDQDSGGWPATLVSGEEILVEAETRKAALVSLWL